ncbi:SAM-dependent methyltransferase [Tumebacillus algifaecis]|uniref:SAM-dependent methyltransferase n=1 Tax=Tumebacillus algifaecis TaxID=1214604 RepID=A0A223D3D2_9BACL|nr:SAM-dependent methyltransferase [Tumebacillus algifaecis]ASS76149.1 SAM-dependent methyltransferase [Tumebacillus algifaecis]
MQTLESLLAKLIGEAQLTQATLSNVRQKDADAFNKVTVKPVLIKDELKYQFTYHFAKKTTNENRSGAQTQQKLVELMQTVFRQALLHSKEADHQVLISKKGSATILKQKATKATVELSHNRKKKYLLEEGKPVPFLIELGVMNKEGKVLAKKYDKFKQINRFLEMIDDVVPFLKKDRILNIVDFGCGKSYLTFALYHYLKEEQGFELNVIGLDLKRDVITHCNALAVALNYEHLTFLHGDINQYDELDQVDLVVTLHACDTATDAALEKAVRWGADVILSVPCCQHELNAQLENKTLETMLQHGIIKERFAALATDSVRAQLLDLVGYKTQLLEFIDLEHTPKNLLIRAVKQERQADVRKIAESYLAFKSFLQIEPYLEVVLKDKLEPIFQLQTRGD